ncbi:50S ribosomal protein L24 [Candidatus Woesearchaeota archaeon]|nr:50S ribosomal protein L24 [Candidatus Woesearchaeota archaeon]
MKGLFSKFWRSSKNPRKQRKYRYNIQKHLVNKLISVNLAKDLRKKYTKRNIPLKRGDKVKIMNGKFEGRVEKVSKILLKETKVYLENIYNIRKDGTKTLSPINPSNLQIIELNLEDKMRKKILERK